jgi:hypothetical protein
MADDRCQPLQGSPACGRGKGGQPGHESHKRGLNTELHLAVDAHGIPLRAFVTQGTTADCTQAMHQGMALVIPPKKNRKKPREYDKHLYKARHLVKNAFL